MASLVWVEWGVPGTVGAPGLPSNRCATVDRSQQRHPCTGARQWRGWWLVCRTVSGMVGVDFDGHREVREAVAALRQWATALAVVLLTTAVVVRLQVPEGRPVILALVFLAAAAVTYGAVWGGYVLAACAPWPPTAARVEMVADRWLVSQHRLERSTGTLGAVAPRSGAGALQEAVGPAQVPGMVAVWCWGRARWANQGISCYTDAHAPLVLAGPERQLVVLGPSRASARAAAGSAVAVCAAALRRCGLVGVRLLHRFPGSRRPR